VYCCSLCELAPSNIDSEMVVPVHPMVCIDNIASIVLFCH
jgi:hypothetical protein